MDFDKAFTVGNKIDQHWYMPINKKFTVYLWAGDIETIRCAPKDNLRSLNDYTHFQLRILYYVANNAYNAAGGMNYAQSGIDITPWKQYNQRYYSDLDLIPKDEVEKLINYLRQVSGENISVVNNSIQKSNGGVCFKCNQFDGYAAPSTKHGGKIVCYKCFS